MSVHTSNVISFPPVRDGTGDSPVPEKSLLEECRGMVAERLGTALSAGFDKVIDELYEQAEHALERDVRDFYLKAKESWPAQRAPIEQTFREQLSARFSPPAADPKDESPQFALVKSAWSELSLVADGDLEEDMRFTELAAKIRNSVDEELVALDQRMAILLERPELAAADNPLAPSGIANAFREALKSVELPIEIKRIALRHFDEQVRPEALNVIRETNERLKKSGILPVIRYGSSKKPQTGTGPADGPRSEGPQVVGSVTLPVVAGGPTSGGGAMAAAFRSAQELASNCLPALR